MATRAIKRIPTVCECRNHVFVPLTKWAVTMTSPEDAWLLLAKNWFTLDIKGHDLAYATGNHGTLLHREIMQAEKGMLVDHENHNGLDNRRPNLRACTSSQNQWNKRAARSSLSIYKGVTRGRTRKGKPVWRAVIETDGVRKSCGGSTYDERSAALLYDAEAIRRFGEFALTNKKLGLLD